MYDVLIIGSGPAGVSASLYTVRAGLTTAVVTNGRGALSRAGKIENYYGFSQPVEASAIYDASIANAERLGVEFLRDEIVGAEYGSEFILKGVSGEYRAKALVIATGSSRRLPKIDGLEKFIGHGVSFCATCDAFFFRGREVAVLGAGDFAVHEADYLSHLCPAVTILSNGREVSVSLPENVRVEKKKIALLKGEAMLDCVVFDDGTELKLNGLFIAEGIAGSDALARMLGAVSESGFLRVGRDMETSFPGLFAAGDCTGGLPQIAKAVSDGAIAGTAAVRFVRNNK